MLMQHRYYMLSPHSFSQALVFHCRFTSASEEKSAIVCCKCSRVFHGWRASSRVANSSTPQQVPPSR